MPKLIVKNVEITKLFAHLMRPVENTRFYDSLVNAANRTDINAEAQWVMTPGYRLLRIDHRERPSSDEFEIALVNDLLKSVVYYNKVVIAPISDLNCRPATQNLVWRTTDIRHSNVIREVPHKVFFNYILSRYDVILSDNHQTGEGKFFWQRQMSYALALGLYVYYYQMLNASLLPIPNQDALDGLADQLWSEDDGQEYHLALISRIALPAASSISIGSSSSLKVVR
ncbi:hypothetical protein [Pseudomonas lutea]|uniref:hypothetical protein n=1 Tax=Pseudomonas lutea TaxID=243924 RepID=UPI00068CF5D9|nr:hypothetical protein [Pseudomonas lutea]